MERRQRKRVKPVGEIQVFIAGSRTPSKVVDFSAAGLSVLMDGHRFLSSKRCMVDIMVGGKLCACGLPGIVRWSNCEAAGITLTPRTDQQKQAVHRVETLALLSDTL